MSGNMRSLSALIVSLICAAVLLFIYYFVFVLVAYELENIISSDDDVNFLIAPIMIIIGLLGLPLAVMVFRRLRNNMDPIED